MQSWIDVIKEETCTDFQVKLPRGKKLHRVPLCLQFRLARWSSTWDVESRCRVSRRASAWSLPCRNKIFIDIKKNRRSLEQDMCDVENKIDTSL